jgi:hypothetical protein
MSARSEDYNKPLQGVGQILNVCEQVELSRGGGAMGRLLGGSAVKIIPLASPSHPLNALTCEKKGESGTKVVEKSGWLGDHPPGFLYSRLAPAGVGGGGGA